MDDDSDVGLSTAAADFVASCLPLLDDVGIDLKDLETLLGKECDAAFNIFDFGLGDFALPLQPTEDPLSFGPIPLQNASDVGEAVVSLDDLLAGLAVPSYADEDREVAHTLLNIGRGCDNNPEASGTPASGCLSPGTTGLHKDVDGYATADTATAYSGSPHPSLVSLQSTVVGSTEALCNQDFGYDKMDICTMEFEDDAILVDDDEDYMVISSPRPPVASDMGSINGPQASRRPALKVSKLIKGALKPIPRFSLQQLASRVKSYAAAGARLRRTKIKAYDGSASSFAR